MNSAFDEDYFENGVVTGVSCYQQYRWMPEMSLKMAHSLYLFLGLSRGDRVLDYGCSKGYAVKALHILGVEAFGCDVSEYAVRSADRDVSDYCRHMQDSRTIPFQGEFRVIISKDVLEHMSEQDVDGFLKEALRVSSRMFLVIPLASSPGTFVVPAYHLDRTHIQVQTSEWWSQKFASKGWRVVDLRNSLFGVKDNWTSAYPGGDGFWTLEAV